MVMADPSDHGHGKKGEREDMRTVVQEEMRTEEHEDRMKIGQKDRKTGGEDWWDNSLADSYSKQWYTLAIIRPSPRGRPLQECRSTGVQETLSVVCLWS